MITEEDLRRVKEYLKSRISRGLVGADSPYFVALAARPDRREFPFFIRELIAYISEGNDPELAYVMERNGIYLRIPPEEFVKLAVKAPQTNVERIVYLGRLQGLSEIDVRNALKRIGYTGRR